MNRRTPTAQSHTNARRTILGLLLLAAFFSSVGHAQTPPVRMSPANSPYPDVAGAQWTKIEGASGRKFLTAILRPAPAHTPAIIPHPAKTTLDVLPGLAAPLLMMHGTADQDIPVEQSREYERTALALRKPLVAVYFEGVGHMVTLKTESQAEARQRGIAFPREHLLR